MTPDNAVKEEAPKRIWLEQQPEDGYVRQMWFPDKPRQGSYKHNILEYTLVDPEREAAIEALYVAAIAALSLLSNIGKGGWAQTPAGDKLRESIVAYEKVTSK